MLSSVIMGHALLAHTLPYKSLPIEFHRIFCAGRQLQGSSSPTPKWMAQRPGFLWLSPTGTSGIFQGVLLQDIIWPLGSTAEHHSMPRCLEELSWVGVFRTLEAVTLFVCLWKSSNDLAGKLWAVTTACSPGSVTSCFYSSAQVVRPVLHHGSRITHPWRAFFPKYIAVLPENEITATNHTPTVQSLPPCS